MTVEEELAEAQKTVQVFQELLNSQGWALLDKLLIEQIEIRNNQNDQLATGLDDLILKGVREAEVSGINLSRVVAHHALAGLTEEVERLKEIVANDDQNDDTEQPAGGPEFFNLGTLGGDSESS